MGCGSKQPTYTPAQAPTLKTYQDSLSQAKGFANTEVPLAYGAREGALADLAKGTDYYNQFQPTDFESGIANTFFEQALNQANRTAGQRASLSVMESAYPAQLSNAISPTIYDIGTYLGNLGNQRAQYSLGNRLDIDPQMILSNYTMPDLSQANAQSSLDYQAAQEKAMADYIKKYTEWNNGEPWEMGLNKMMSIADPGGSYMNFYTNPNKPNQYNAKDMSSIPEALELNNAWVSVMGAVKGGGGGGVSAVNAKGLGSVFGGQ